VNKGMPQSCRRRAGAVPRKADPLEVIDLAVEGREAWCRYAAAHRDSTVYHLDSWERVFTTCFGYKSWLLAARQTDTGEIAGILPLYLVRSPFGSRLTSVPFRDRGGIVCDSPQAFDALVRETRRLAAASRVNMVELKCPTPYAAEDIARNRLCEYRYWVNSRVDLHELDAESLLARVGAKTRNMIRQAERASLEFKISESPDASEAWYGLHLATQKRLGLPPFPPRFFRLLFEMLMPLGNARMCLACHRGTPIAGTIILTHHDTATYAYSASLREGRRYRANDYLMFNIISWLLDSGVRHFDLGSDSPAQKELLFFKRKWLAVQEELPTYTLGRSPLHLADSSRPLFVIARGVLRHFPPTALRALGSVVTKYFG
jgi:CelD/BcsL family acetyltransferase involved in cellulose biosynthesis